ncbi:MAG: dolichyl-phosphate beta-glucosyltransferase [Candidatus Dormiibacterota bacterium]
MISHDLPLSVVVPAFNEEARLPLSLERIRRHLDGGGRRYEVLIVDDGSIDGTGELVRAKIADWPELHLLRLPRNQGKGAAVRAGMLQVSGMRRLFTDADLSTPIEELAKLEAELDRGAGVAIGSRAVAGARVELHQPFHRELMGKTYNRLLQLAALPGLHDTQCGFKLFSADAALSCFPELECPGFGFDAEVLLRARAGGIRIAEVGVTWRNSRGTTVSSVHDGGQMLFELRRLRSCRRRLARALQHP